LGQSYAKRYGFVKRSFTTFVLSLRGKPENLVDWKPARSFSLNIVRPGWFQAMTGLPL
jgi:hypothetical protein